MLNFWLVADVKYKYCLNWVPQLTKIQRPSGYSRNKYFCALKFTWGTTKCDLWQCFSLGSNWLRSYFPRICTVNRIRREIPQCAEQSHGDSYPRNRRSPLMILYLQSTSASCQKMFMCLSVAWNCSNSQ